MYSWLGLGISVLLSTLASSVVVRLGEADNIFTGSYFDKSVEAILVAEWETLLASEVVVIESIANASLASNIGCGELRRSVGEQRMYCANRFGDTRAINGDMEVIPEKGRIPSLSPSLLQVELLESRRYCSNSFGDTRGITGDIIVTREGGGMSSLSFVELLLVLEKSASSVSIFPSLSID